jgi:hypothetical protein
MANTHQHIDLTTLKEVERLLTSAEIASVEAAGSSSGRSIEMTADTSTGFAPLPKRR